MNASAAILWITLAATGASAPSSPTDKKESFGAVVGPAFLPAGATAAYAFIGLPEVGAGFRQGLGFGEWEARARVDYLTLSATAEVVGKYGLYHWGKLDYGPFLGAGVTLSSGARYFDAQAFTYAGVRLLGGVALTYRVLDTLQILARLDVPFDWPLGTGGGSRAAGWSCTCRTTSARRPWASWGWTGSRRRWACRWGGWGTRWCWAWGSGSSSRGRTAPAS
jgi:hypothetical protein